MGENRDLYSYQRRDDETGKTLRDGTHIVYVNGATRSDTGVGKLVHDLLCRDASKMYFEVLKKRVGQFKDSEEWRCYMCEAFERIAQQNKAEGKREGKRETMLATAKRLLANGKLMLKEIAECTGLSLAQVKKMQASMA